MEPKVMLFANRHPLSTPQWSEKVLATIRMLDKKKNDHDNSDTEMNFAYEVADRVLFFDRKGIYETRHSRKMIFDATAKNEHHCFYQKN